MSAIEIRSLNGHKLNDEIARSNIEKLRTESQQYTNDKISQLINSAPTTLDTLGEIAAAMAENATVVEALDTAIGSKADKNYIDETIANLNSSDIGAAPSEHTQAASTITEGIFGGTVAAKGDSQAPNTFLLRNSKLVATKTTPTVNGEICWLYE